MATLPIRKYPDLVLRQSAEPVGRITKDVKRLVRDMMDTMHQAGGIGLAAPQVGISKRIIVIDISDQERKEGKKSTSGPMAFLNPEVVFQEGLIEGEEGCLSFSSELRGSVPRARRVTVKVMKLDGQETSLQAEDLLSRVLQHEIDHLNGILFIDRMSFSQKLKLRDVLNGMDETLLRKSFA